MTSNIESLKEKYAWILNNGSPSEDPSQPCIPKGICFKIQNAACKTVGYLGGLVHITTEHSILDNPKISKKFAKSTHIGFETLETDSSELFVELLAKRMSPEENAHTIEICLQMCSSKNTHPFLRRVCQDLKKQLDAKKIEEEKFAAQFIISMLSSIFVLAKLTTSQEALIQERAKNEKKKLLGIESKEYQTKIFINHLIQTFFVKIKEDTQAYLLDEVVKSRAIVDGWLQGVPADFEDIYPALELEKRNESMAMRIHAFLSEQQGKPFFWMGADHLRGPHSVCLLLSQKNWHIVPMRT